ncbi:MAG TPA: serine/threonine-protein kinase [Gaiellaceae bacterium]|nr:serine/threonine-protein kinase [Gaiellaceae bacterium]
MAVRRSVAGFDIGPEIGRGAMGVVYLAEDASGQGVALKLLAPELAADDRFRRRFLRESAVAASLDHPNVVPTVAAGDDGGILFLALGYVKGADLRVLIRRERRLDTERALRVVGDAGKALDAAHAVGLVHRDVKPGNILVADDGTSYVCDFGLARHVSSVGSLTGDRGFVGTVDYVAPEQITGGRVDGRADVYALACVLFECLAGVRPFERDSELAVVFAHLNETPPRISDHRPELAPLDSVFVRALVKSPEDRYPTCRALVDAARAALAGEGAPARRLHPAMTALAAALLAVAAAIAGWEFLYGGGHRTAAPRPAVTQSSIEGVHLGMTIPQVKRLLGSPWRQDVFSAPGFPTLIFHARDLSAYFDGQKPRVVIVTTWNPAYHIAGGIGPCSKIEDAKRVFGSDLKPSRWNTQHGRVFGYTLGQNLFLAMIGTPKRVTDTIGVVALYDGDGPNNDGRGVDVSGGTLPFAGFVALSETTCSV